MECSKISPALSLLMKHLVIGQRQKAPNFLAFFGHYTVVCFVATMVVHSQKRTETSLTLSVPDVISGRGDVGLITLVDVYFAKITLRV